MEHAKQGQPSLGVYSVQMFCNVWNVIEKEENVLFIAFSEKDEEGFFEEGHSL